MKTNTGYYLCQCGARFGLHRWRTLQCPNPAWKPGNGRSQWLICSYQATQKEEPHVQQA